MPLIKSPRSAARIGYPSLTPFPTLESVENRMRRLFEGDWDPFSGSLMTQTLGWVPPMEISETADELALTAELPGMSMKDVDVTVDEGMLVVRGEKSEQADRENKKFHLTERTYGSFQRAFTLPRSVDASKISAIFTNGVLTVKMPKTAEGKAKGRKVEITPGG